MPLPVEISFDCLPLRSLGRLDVPLDAADEFRAKYLRVKQALAKHGLHNTYYLHNASCTFHLTNHPQIGMVEFRFEGTVLTDPQDRAAIGADLEVELHRETCDWLTEPVVSWFRETVKRAVLAEFDRYIAAGDLAKTVARLEQIRSQSDAHGGFLGMGL